MKPAGDHQMNHKEEFILQLEDDALAEPAQTYDDLSLSRRDRRVERAHDERAADPDLLNRLLEDALVQRFDVNRYVGEFRHCLPSRTMAFKSFKTSLPSGLATNADREWSIEDRDFAPFTLPFLKDFSRSREFSDGLGNVVLLLSSPRDDRNAKACS
jgi:hypothetical protein